jgi:signal transduction histidine kinase
VNGRERATITGVSPEPIAETFDLHCERLSTRYIRFVAIVEIATGPGLWWLTSILHPGQSALAAAYRYFEAGFGIAGALTLAVLAVRSSWLSARTLSTVNLVITSAGLGVACALAPQPAEVPYHTLCCGFFMIAWSIRQRAIALTAGVVAFVGGAIATAPQRAADIQLINAYVYYSCIAFATFLLGHILYRVVRENWNQRRELADRATALAEQERRLAQSNVELARRVAERTEQLRRLASHLDASREDERRRIARELHDELGQLLTGIRMEVAAERQVSGGPEPGVCERIDGLLDQAFAASRNLVYELRPRVLDDLGLVPAVEWYVERFRERSGLDVALDVVAGRETSPALATTLFRALQESLTNVARHARATRVNVALRDEGERLVLSVEDDGCGFDVERTTGGFGVLGLRERALAAGGTLAIDSRDGRGTRVMFGVPCRGDA